MPRKGQKLSKRSIDRGNETRSKTLRSKYDWERVEKYLDCKLDKSSRNRKKKFITLREFKVLIDEGLVIGRVPKNGPSKHLIQFYSNLVQGKIKLSKEKFIEEYESGISLEDIARKHHITRGDIMYLRQLYDIKTKGAKFMNRKATEEPLTSEQIQILYGSMMGDAKKASSASTGFGQCVEQKDYLLWKYEKFENVASPSSLKGYKSIDYRSEKENISWRFYTFSNSDIEKCNKLFYRINKDTGELEKHISQETLDFLTPLSIAVWYMDDGRTDFGHRTKIRHNFASAEYAFCSESFSIESYATIQKWFKERYDITVELKDKEISTGKGYRIKIHYKDNDKFIELIKPYILPMFDYKINYNNYIKDFREPKETQMLFKDLIKCPLGADFSILEPQEQDEYINGLVKYIQDKGILSLIGKPEDYIDHLKAVLKNPSQNLIKDSFISFSNLGNKFLMSHFASFLEGKAKGYKSIKEIFENKKYLSDILRKIIKQGYFPEVNKIFRNILKYKSNKPLSGFMPCVAKAIYIKYCDDNSKVLDFCSGYGGRFFGAMACDKIISYTGIEANFQSYSDLHQLRKNLKLFGDISKNVNLINQDSVIAMQQFRDKIFDFCFTSPPYFDAEEYDTDKSQSQEQYTSYGAWFNGFLIAAIQEARRVAKKVAINISNTGSYDIADDLRNWIKKNNIPFVEHQLRLPKYGTDFRWEPIFVIE